MGFAHVSAFDGRCSCKSSMGEQEFRNLLTSDIAHSLTRLHLQEYNDQGPKRLLNRECMQCVSFPQAVDCCKSPILMFTCRKPAEHGSCQHKLDPANKQNIKSHDMSKILHEQHKSRLPSGKLKQSYGKSTLNQHLVKINQLCITHIA